MGECQADTSPEMNENEKERSVRGCIEALVLFLKISRPGRNSRYEVLKLVVGHIL